MISRRAYLIITRVAKWRVVKQEGTSCDATESPREYTMKVRLRDLYLSFSPRKRKRERERERDELLRDRSLLIMGDVYESYREK